MVQVVLFPSKLLFSSELDARVDQGKPETHQRGQNGFEIMLTSIYVMIIVKFHIHVGVSIIRFKIVNLYKKRFVS